MILKGDIVKYKGRLWQVTKIWDGLWLDLKAKERMKYETNVELSVRESKVEQLKQDK